MPASTSMAVLFAAFVGLFAGVNNGANAQTYPSGPVSFERFDLSPAQFSSPGEGGRRQARVTCGN